MYYVHLFANAIWDTLGLLPHDRQLCTWHAHNRYHRAHSISQTLCGWPNIHYPVENRFASACIKSNQVAGNKMLMDAAEAAAEAAQFVWSRTHGPLQH